MKRVQEAEIFIIIKNRGGRSEDYFIEERMRRGKERGKAWRYSRRGRITLCYST